MAEPVTDLYLAARSLYFFPPLGSLGTGLHWLPRHVGLIGCLLLVVCYLLLHDFVCFRVYRWFHLLKENTLLIFGHGFSYTSWLASLLHGNTETKSVCGEIKKPREKGFSTNTRIYQWAPFSAYHTFPFRGCHIQLPSSLDLERYPVECINFQTHFILFIILL